MKKERCCDLGGLGFIEVGGRRVGLLGLEKAFAAAAACPEQSREKLAALLLEKVAEKNWIPAESREAYAQALVRAYERWRKTSVGSFVRGETRSPGEV